MTYFGFLALFLLIPIVFLGVVAISDQRRGITRPAIFGNFPVWAVLALHVGIAVVWTTPWDNYLVATRVWWYDPALVTGITFGYVPVEEYTFFVLQPILSGLWLALLLRRLPVPAMSTNSNGVRLRTGASVLAGVLWIASGLLLWSGWLPGRYLGLELAWALAPLLVQLAFGADILWRYRRLILVAILPPTIYLSAADALAIQAGTWTINPALSLDVHLLGVLPVEEFLFFLLTNTMLVFGMTLALAVASKARAAGWLSRTRKQATRQATQ